MKKWVFAVVVLVVGFLVFFYIGDFQNPDREVCSIPEIERVVKFSADSSLQNVEEISEDEAVKIQEGRVFGYRVYFSGGLPVGEWESRVTLPTTKNVQEIAEFKKGNSFYQLKGNQLIGIHKVSSSPLAGVKYISEHFTIEEADPEGEYSIELKICGLNWAKVNFSLKRLVE